MAAVQAPAGMDMSPYPVWLGLIDPVFGLDNFAPYIKYNTMPNYRTYAWDPTSPRSSAQPVLKVQYKKGAWSPNAAVQGGMLFHAYPFGKGAPIARRGAIFEYDVYFPKDFDWIKGGKLPGMAGGSASCGGGADPATCWSARVMWRREGAGEAYLYVPLDQQAPSFCQDRLDGTRTYCNAAAGTSFRRGAFTFKAGSWHNIRIRVELNTPGKRNGVIQLDVDGVTKIRYDGLVYRTTDSLPVSSLYMASWFGGSDASWAPRKDTSISRVPKYFIPINNQVTCSGSFRRRLVSSAVFSLMGGVAWIPTEQAWMVYLFSFSPSDWMVLNGCVPCILLGFLWMLSADYRRRELRRLGRARCPTTVQEPSAAVRIVVPLRGVREHSSSNLSSILAQEYAGRLEWVFVVDDDEDPICPLLEDLIAQMPKDVAGRTTVLVAGKASSTSQKIHNQLAGILHRGPKNKEETLHEYVLCLDDDVQLPPKSVMWLVCDLEKDPQAFMCTGYPFDVPPASPGSDTVSSYAILSYHLPLSIGFSIAEHTSFVWGGCMLFRSAALVPGHPAGLLEAWQSGSYSDDLTAAATCGAKSLPILCPAHAVFLQPVAAHATVPDAWRYLRRQLAVLDTYPDARTRRTHWVLAVAHAYWSLALLAPFAILAMRLARSYLISDSSSFPSSVSWLEQRSPLAVPCLIFAWLFGWVGLYEMVQTTLALCETGMGAGLAQKNKAIPRFCWWKLGLGFLLNNALIPICLLVAFASPTISWAGIRYTIRGGRVVHVQHPER